MICWIVPIFKEFLAVDDVDSENFQTFECSFDSSEISLMHSFFMVINGVVPEETVSKNIKFPMIGQNNKVGNFWNSFILCKVLVQILDFFAEYFGIVFCLFDFLLG